MISICYGIFNPGFEIYHDFYAYYAIQLKDLSEGLLPYRDFAYSYPPLFLYTLYPFFSLGYAYLASIPILLSDALTSVLIYLIARQFGNPRIAFFAGLSYALSPFFLLYEGYLWFSSQPMTFFFLMSIYLLLSKRPIFSFAAFAFAILFKQEVMFVLPLYIILYLRDYRGNFLRGFSTFCGILLVFSIPFLVLAPGAYVTSLSLRHSGSYLHPTIDTRYWPK